MANFESKFKYQLIKDKIVIYLRCLGDVLFIWKGATLKQETLGNKPILRQEQRSSNNHLWKTDGQTRISLATSYHSKSSKKSIPYSQILVVTRTCSTITEFN